MTPTLPDFFTGISNTKPYFKAAFEGFAGTGKTHTAALIAIGLFKKIKSKKPLIFFDTEKASKFLKPLFAKAKIEVLVKESRSMADLAEAMRFCREGGSDIMIIDSISHVWENLLEAFKRSKNRTFLQFQDWGIIKPTWKTEFSDPFVNDPYHIIMCGRAGYEYADEINPDTKRREIHKVGVKMKVEGDTAYEPDVLVLMNRVEDVLNSAKVQIYRTATIIKDRSTVIDGKIFTNPTFKDFEPAIDVMLANPEYKVDEETDAAPLFKTDEDKYQYLKDKKIALEEIQGQLVKAWPSQSAVDKKEKMDCLDLIFDTRSWAKVGSFGLKALTEGLDALSEHVIDVFKARDAEFEDNKKPEPAEQTAKPEPAKKPAPKPKATAKPKVKAKPKAKQNTK